MEEDQLEEMLELELWVKEKFKVWKAEKASLSGTQNIKLELDKTKNELELARRSGDLNKMSELQYGKIPELEKQLITF